MLYLEVGDRTPGGEGSYPDDDLKALLQANASWKFVHTDGSSIRLNKRCLLGMTKTHLRTAKTSSKHGIPLAR